MSRCQRCAVSTAVPGVVLNTEGICNLCVKQAAIENSDIHDYAKALKDELGRFRGDGEYDAIVCLSGGKDSSYALVQAIKTYGLRVLAFTLDNGFLSHHALANIHGIVDGLGVDHVMLRPNMRTFRQIIKISATQKIYNIQTLRRISSVCQSCITMVINGAVTLAIEKRAPLVIGGFTLGQVPRGRFGYELLPRVLNEMRADIVTTLSEYVEPEVAERLLISPHLESTAFIPYMVNPLCAVEVDEEEIVATVKSLGWSQPEDVDGCSSNCRLNAFANYAHERRHGYNPYELELADLVRRGLLSREKMMEKITSNAEAVRVEIMKELDVNV